MKLAVFTVGTPEYNLEETVDILKGAGYDGVEWRVKNPPPEEKPENYSYEGRYWSYNKSTLDIDKIVEIAPQVKNLCSNKGIEICSLTTYLGVSDLSLIENVMRAATIMGCRQIRVNAPTFEKGRNYNELFAETQTHMADVQALAKKYNIRVNMEIHMGNIIPTASAAYRLVSPFDSKYIGIIHDAGNMVHEGYEDYRLGIELLGDYLAHVHIKNACWKLKSTDDQGVESWGPVWAPLKKGYADLPRLISELKAAGYDGYMSVEDFSNEADTETKLRENYEYLKKLTD